MPPPYAGAGRKVYPGFIQLTNFISMNMEKHQESMNQLFEHLVRGDEEEAEKRLNAQRPWQTRAPGAD